MPRNRAMILTSIWQDRDFVALKPATKLVYLALLSQPDVSHLGLMSVAYRRWAAALGGSVEWVEGCVAELAAARFVVLDAEHDQLLIRSYMRNDGVFRQPQVLQAAASAVPLVASPVIASAILEELARARAEEPLTDKATDLVVLMEAQLKTLGEGFPEPSGSLPAAFEEPPSSLLEGSSEPLGARGSSSGVSTDLAVPRVRARGTRLPADFAVSPAMVAWFNDRVPGLDGRSETEKFRNYWNAKAGKDATKLDWVATWRNWMLSAYERLPRPATPGQAQRSTGEIRAQAALDAGDRLAERLAREGGS